MNEPRLTEQAEAETSYGNTSRRITQTPPTAWLMPFWSVAACIFASLAWAKTATISEWACAASSCRRT